MVRLVCLTGTFCIVAKRYVVWVGGGTVGWGDHELL